MVDRISLLQALESKIAPNSAQQADLRKTIDKAIVLSILSLPLSGAQSLSHRDKAELEIGIRDFLGQREAEKLSAAWEPSRKLDKDTKDSVKPDLIDLLQGRRVIYRVLKGLSLHDARALDARAKNELRLWITRLAPLKDIKPVLKAWDKNFPNPTGRDEFVSRLLSLLDGADVAPKRAAA